MDAPRAAVTDDRTDSLAEDLLSGPAGGGVEDRGGRSKDKRADRPKPGAAGDLVVSRVADRAGLDTIKEAWRAVWADSRDATPFQSWEWADAWERHYGAEQELWILVARAGSTVVGIMPLGLSRSGRLGPRRLGFLGDYATDFSNLVARRGYEEAALKAFLGFLKAERAAWDLIDLQHVPNESVLAEAVPPSGLRLRRAICRFCLVKPLDASWDQLLGGMSQNMRGNLRRRQRQLDRDFKSAVFDITPAAEREDTLGALFDLNRARWNARRGEGASFFDSPRMQDFQKDVAQAFEERGWLRLHRLRVDGKTRAVAYCLQFGDRYDFYNASFDLELAKYSLGIVLLSQAIASACREGAREFAFGRGNTTYKYAWKPIERPSYRFLVSNGTLRSQLAFALASGYSYLEEKNVGVKLSNLLWGQQSLPVRLRERWQRVVRRVRPKSAAAGTAGRRPGPGHEHGHGSDDGAGHE